MENSVKLFAIHNKICNILYILCTYIQTIETLNINK